MYHGHSFWPIALPARFLEPTIRGIWPVSFSTLKVKLQFSPQYADQPASKAQNGGHKQGPHDETPALGIITDNIPQENNSHRAQDGTEEGPQAAGNFFSISQNSFLRPLEGREKFSITIRPLFFPWPPSPFRLISH